MQEEWYTDRELDVYGVKTILQSQFPELNLEALEHIGSGWDFDAYLANDEFVFRFPRRREIAEYLVNEERILSQVSSGVEEIIQIPKIVFRGFPDKNFPYPFIAHRFIEGKAADDPEVKLSSKIDSDLGAVLTALHSISPTPETIHLKDEARQGCRIRYVETLELLSLDERAVQFVPAACEWLQNSPEVPVEFAGPSCFIHNDICPDHLIVNSETGRLTGIIDWSDAAFGDPVWDFVALVLWKGREFTEAVVSHYGNDLDSGFVDRLRFLARTSSLKWLIDAIKRESDIGKHVGWVENAFES